MTTSGQVNENATFHQLSEWFSSPRMHRFNNHSDPNALYLWNTWLTKAFLEDIQHTEVLLRNWVDRSLTGTTSKPAYGETWFTSDRIPFTNPALRSINKAVKRTGQSKRITEPGRVIAELSFDFWYFLFTPTYTTTIWPKLHASLQEPVDRELFRRTLETVYELRNRCAHHEPVISHDLDYEHEYLDKCQVAIQQVCHWVNPEAARWVNANFRITQIRNNRPA